MFKFNQRWIHFEIRKFYHFIFALDRTVHRFSVARDFTQNQFFTAKCKQSLTDSPRKEMKIILSFPRALNSGWLPTNSPHMNQFFNCRSDVGIIGIHAQGVFPSSYFKLTHGQSYSFKISPTLVRSDEKIRKIDPRMWVFSLLLRNDNNFIIYISRNCYFEDERKLLYFNKYSEENCLIECRSLITEESCLCVPFNYPRKFASLKFEKSFNNFHHCRTFAIEDLQKRWYNVHREGYRSFTRLFIGDVPQLRLFEGLQFAVVPAQSDVWKNFSEISEKLHRFRRFLAWKWSFHLFCW